MIKGFWVMGYGLRDFFSLFFMSFKTMRYGFWVIRYGLRAVFFLMGFGFGYAECVEVEVPLD